MRFRRIAGLATLITACALAISGCNGGGSPEGTTLTGDGDTTTASASPTTTASPTPTKTTGTTQPETEEQKVIRTFVAALNTMTASGDTKPFLALCTSKSEGCAVAAKSIADVYKAGGSFDGPTYRITDWALAPTGKNPVKVQAYLAYDAYTYTEKKGTAPKSGKAGSDLYEFHLVREGSTWKVQQYFVP
ncbi:DUF6318 family protein [Flindersiella endophytica]